jgi:hypothetical protein
MNDLSFLVCTGKSVTGPFCMKLTTQLIQEKADFRFEHSLNYVPLSAGKQDWWTQREIGKDC